MTGIILYDKNQKLIFPITSAEVVSSAAFKEKGNVEECLLQLFKNIADITGDTEAAANILVNVTYLRANTKELSEIKKIVTGWSDRFELPNSEFPYSWKHTIFTYRGEEQIVNELYEIVSTDVAEKTLDIYIARSTGTAPIITYPILVDGYGNPILDDNGKELENLKAFDSALPSGWLGTPVSIGPATPYVFLATRKRIDGAWERFSEPAQYGRWAFDSQLEIRYSITEDNTPPTLLANKDDPGVNWSENTPPDFIGRLWMITATSVNGILNSNNFGVRWKGPNLLAIIQ